MWHVNWVVFLGDLCRRSNGQRRSGDGSSDPADHTVGVSIVNRANDCPSTGNNHGLGSRGRDERRTACRVWQAGQVAGESALSFLSAGQLLGIIHNWSNFNSALLFFTTLSFRYSKVRLLSLDENDEVTYTRSFMTIFKLCKLISLYLLYAPVGLLQLVC